MSDEAPAGFEEPLLETRQGPVLDGHGENEPAKEIAEVVGDHPEEQPHLIGPEPVTGEAGHPGGGGSPPRPPSRAPSVGVLEGVRSACPTSDGNVIVKLITTTSPTVVL